MSHDKIISIDAGRRHHAVDLGSLAATAEERRLAYRSSLRPATPVQEALVDTLAALQTRLRELPDAALMNDEELVLRAGFYDAMRTFRKLQNLARQSPEPDEPRKAA